MFKVHYLYGRRLEWFNQLEKSALKCVFAWFMRFWIISLEVGANKSDRSLFIVRSNGDMKRQINNIYQIPYYIPIWSYVINHMFAMHV